MRKQTLKFGENVVNKKEFHASKQAIALNSVESSKILVSDKFELRDDSCKFFIDCLHDDDVIKPEMAEKTSFLIEDENEYLKYNKIWNKTKKLINIKFYSQPIHDSKYIKAKVKAFDEVIKTHFSDNKVPKKKIITFVLQLFVLILC